MEETKRPGVGVRLDLEPWTGTAIIDGERIGLPAKEFQVLALLAARLGQPTTYKDLIESVYPETPWLSSQDVTYKIWRLRKRIGDQNRERRIVSNRKGFGYFLDLSPSHVRVLDESPEDTTPEARDEPEDTPLPIAALEIAEQPSVSSTWRPESARRLVLPAAAVIAVLVLAISAVAGRNRDAGLVSTTPSESPAEIKPDVAKEPTVVKGKHLRRERLPKRSTRAGSTRSETVVAGGAPIGSSTAADPVSRDSKPEPKDPVLAAPSRYLFHLINTQTGDHFVTIDPSAVSDYQARGYTGGAIGRVYDRRVPGTTAITTNAGTAFIFIASAPKTEPRSETRSLWLATSDNGDFFYTTDEREAHAEGWTASRVGYVRTP
jgi:DNA-binding winged helix-turn-helix (wHTH) protein